jgi:rubredoxin
MSDRIFVCGRCRVYEFDERYGDPTMGIPNVVRWEDLLELWCPLCGGPKSGFVCVVD